MDITNVSGEDRQLVPPMVDGLELVATATVERLDGDGNKETVEAPASVVLAGQTIHVPDEWAASLLEQPLNWAPAEAAKAAKKAPAKAATDG